MDCPNTMHRIAYQRQHCLPKLMRSQNRHSWDFWVVRTARIDPSRQVSISEGDAESYAFFWMMSEALLQSMLGRSLPRTSRVSV